MIETPQPTSSLSASDIRAVLAWAGVRAYCIAARLRIHPTTFSQIMNGKRPFDQALATRILAAIEVEVAENEPSRLETRGRLRLSDRG